MRFAPAHFGQQILVNCLIIFNCVLTCFSGLPPSFLYDNYISCKQSLSSDRLDLLFNMFMVRIIIKLFSIIYYVSLHYVKTYQIQINELYAMTYCCQGNSSIRRSITLDLEILDYYSSMVTKQRLFSRVVRSNFRCSVCASCVGRFTHWIN